jgi:flagellar biosynthesis protein FlhB
MAEEKEQDRTEQATPFKLREARKQGQVAKSVELTAWVILLMTTAFIYIFGRKLIASDLRLSEALFSQSGHILLSGHNTLRLFSAATFHILSTFWFLIALIIGFALLANFIQTGPVFSWQPLKPDFKRINPVTGFKKLFNKRIIYELGKTLFKIALVCLIIGLFIDRQINTLMGLLYTDIQAHPAEILHQILMLAFWLLGGLASVAIFDFAFTKWEFSRNMRMSRREMRDEVKRREGDPKIKQKIRELQREAATRGASVSRIPDADVLITNPTHLSIAVLYKQGEMAAPIVIAKGAGEMALRMRIKARQHRVPLVENKALACKLFERVRIDEPIIPEVYASVAKILTQIYRTRAADAHSPSTQSIKS